MPWNKLEIDLRDPLYMLLEPCSFKGRTPACAKAIIKAGADRVVVGTIDPDPRNSGRGIEMLRARALRRSIVLRPRPVSW